jgi:regulator of sigma E protease
MGTLTSILVLSFLIFFHELGHFLAARFFGVHVEVFNRDW